VAKYQLRWLEKTLGMADESMCTIYVLVSAKLEERWDIVSRIEQRTCRVRVAMGWGERWLADRLCKTSLSKKS
jgi:hypothetical protein